MACSKTVQKKEHWLLILQCSTTCRIYAILKQKQFFFFHFGCVSGHSKTDRRPLQNIFVNSVHLMEINGLETREYGRRDPLRWPCDTLYPQKLALTSSKSGGRSVGIVCLRTKATELLLLVVIKSCSLCWKNVYVSWNCVMLGCY
jgi:hypothetical protein